MAVCVGPRNYNKLFTGFALEEEEEEEEEEEVQGK